MKIFPLSILTLILLGLISLAIISSGKVNSLVSPFQQAPVKETAVFPIKEVIGINKLEDIFENLNIDKEQLPKEDYLTIIATGDVIPARSVNFKSSQRGFTWAYKNVSQIISSADLSLINLESPLIKDCPLTTEGMVFCGSQKHIEGIKLMGVDVVNLANNHAGNYGQLGLEQTIQLLSAEDILTTGIDGPAYKEVKGKKLAFLGYNDVGSIQTGLSSAIDEKIRSEITNVRKDADLIVVSFHWGDEYTEQPTERQRQLAHLSIDSGADLAVGNHPHWIQPLEIYQGKLIIYAHGNLIFDQMWSEKTRQGIIGAYTFYQNRLVDVKFYPVYIEDFGQPRLLEELERDKILNNLMSISTSLKDKYSY